MRRRPAAAHTTAGRQGRPCNSNVRCGHHAKPLKMRENPAIRCRQPSSGYSNPARLQPQLTVEGVGLDKAVEPHALVRRLPLQPPALGCRIPLRRRVHALRERQAHGPPGCRAGKEQAGRERC